MVIDMDITLIINSPMAMCPNEKEVKSGRSMENSEMNVLMNARNCG